MRRYYRFMIYLMRAPGRYIHSLAWALQDSVGSNLVLVIKLIQQGRCHAYLLGVNGVTRSCEAHNLHQELAEISDRAWRKNMPQCVARLPIWAFGRPDHKVDRVSKIHV
jgi:hypothetical protein